MNASRIAMNVALKITGRISQRRGPATRSAPRSAGPPRPATRSAPRSAAVSMEVMTALCDDLDRGTREGFILVLKAPLSSTTNDAHSDDVRRRELADFLRNRRAEISPEDVGLPGGGRRRTPGLRREEVAQLAGVGTTWYTWLEQARDVRASRAVLEALAAALSLPPAERRHLVLLGRGESAPPPPVVTEEVSAPVRRLIANLGLSPAYILGGRWDYL